MPIYSSTINPENLQNIIESWFGKLIISFPNHTYSHISLSANNVRINNIWDNVELDISSTEYAYIFTFDIKEYTDDINLEWHFDTETNINISSNIIHFRSPDEYSKCIVVYSLSDDTEIEATSALSVHYTKQADNLYLTRFEINRNWFSSPARVHPIRLKLYIIPASLHITAKAIEKVHVMTTQSDQVYYDPRPTSAVQFAVEFFDDKDYTRPRPYKEGWPVCSTVPHGIGNISNMTNAEIQSWNKGIGFDKRTVYLQFIASKDISLDKTVYYDIHLPGTLSYYRLPAERTGYLGSLPIFRGRFDVMLRQPPSIEDGIGYIDAYIEESRINDIPLEINMIAYQTSSASIQCTVLSDTSVSAIEIDADVINNYSEDVEASVNISSSIGVSTINLSTDIISFPDTYLYIDLFSNDWASGDNLVAYAATVERDSNTVFRYRGITISEANPIKLNQTKLNEVVAVYNNEMFWYTIWGRINSSHDYSDDWFNFLGDWDNGFGYSLPVFSHPGGIIIKETSENLPDSVVEQFNVILYVTNRPLYYQDIERFNFIENPYQIPTLINVKLTFEMYVDSTTTVVHYNKMISPNISIFWNQFIIKFTDKDGFVPLYNDTLDNHLASNVTLTKLQLEIRPSYLEWHHIDYTNPRTQALLANSKWWDAAEPSLRCPEFPAMICLPISAPYIGLIAITS